MKGRELQEMEDLLALSIKWARDGEYAPAAGCLVQAAAELQRAAERVEVNQARRTKKTIKTEKGN